MISDLSRLLEDPLLPWPIRLARMRARIIRHVNDVRNAEILRWAILRGMDDTFRRASLHFEEQLDMVIRATRRVIADSRSRPRE